MNSRIKITDSELNVYHDRSKLMILSSGMVLFSASLSLVLLREKDAPLVLTGLFGLMSIVCIVLFCRTLLLSRGGFLQLKANAQSLQVAPYFGSKPILYALEDIEKIVLSKRTVSVEKWEKGYSKGSAILYLIEQESSGLIKDLSHHVWLNPSGRRCVSLGLAGLNLEDLQAALSKICGDGLKVSVHEKVTLDYIAKREIYE